MLRSLLALAHVALLSIVFAGPFARAENMAPNARFDKWLDILEPTIYSSKDPKKVAEMAIGGSARSAGFNLQALAKLYKHYDKDFKAKFDKFADQFELLENHIGEVDKWDKALKKAEKKDKKDDEKIAELKEKVKESTQDFAKFLEKEKWVTEKRKDSFLADFRDFLRDTDWPSYANDKNRILELLEGELENISQTKYDLKTLEKGNGLHELRRDLRWHQIKAQVVNGLITYAEDDAQCPLPVYRPLTDPEGALAKSPYSQLPRPGELETEPCEISKCVLFGIVDLQRQLGDIKDEAEGIELTGNEHKDRVPLELAAKAEALWQTARENRLLEAAIDELKACRR